MRKGRNESIREKILKLYGVKEKSFFLRVDWLLENAVYPLENPYAANLMDLWNVYMPGYKFDKIILEYSIRDFNVLRYVHDGEIFTFNSLKRMQECTIKNYVKFCISQGNTTRMAIVNECFNLLKDISDRTKLYDSINRTIEFYLTDGEISQQDIMFLERFQDYSEQPYSVIVERMTDIYEHRVQSMSARNNIIKVLNISEEKEENIRTLINVLLCRIALSDGEKKVSSVIEDTWKKTVNTIPYTTEIYSFIEKFEKSYMSAAYYGIKDIKDSKIIKQLYKDSIILCAVLQAIENNNKCGLKDVNEFWKKDGMHFAKGYFFSDEFERMQGGFNANILLKHKKDILTFHDILIKKINTADFIVENNSHLREPENISSEIENTTLNEKDRRIEELKEKISDLEEKLDKTEKEVLSKFISLLDNKKYDHVLGKLYRAAYTDETINIKDTQIILKNLFEIMNISGIDIYGDLGSKVNIDEIRKGKYRVDNRIKKDAILKYPGYKLGNSVILHPLVEEV